MITSTRIFLSLLKATETWKGSRKEKSLLCLWIGVRQLNRWRHLLLSPKICVQFPEPTEWRELTPSSHPWALHMVPHPRTLLGHCRRKPRLAIHRPEHSALKQQSLPSVQKVSCGAAHYLNDVQSYRLGKHSKDMISKNLSRKRWMGWGWGTKEQDRERNSTGYSCSWQTVGLDPLRIIHMEMVSELSLQGGLLDCRVDFFSLV